MFCQMLWINWLEIDRFIEEDLEKGYHMMPLQVGKNQPEGPGLKKNIARGGMKSIGHEHSRKESFFFFFFLIFFFYFLYIFILRAGLKTLI